VDYYYIIITEAINSYK